MAGTGTRQDQSESQLCALLIRKRVLTDGQLKAALDYQRSLGGDLKEILVRLNLVRPQQLAALESGEPIDGPGEESDGSVIDPTMLKVADLTVHRKLLEKIPHELVQRYLLVTFFPAGKVSQRRIILGHGVAIPPDAASKVGSLLGVQLCSLALEMSAAASLLQTHGFLPSDWSPASVEEARGSAPARPGPEEGPASSAEPGARTASNTTQPSAESREPTAAPSREDRLGHVLQRSGKEAADAGARSARPEDAPSSVSAADASVLTALVSVLAKKGLITREEIEVEIELSRIRHKADSLTPA